MGGIAVTPRSSEEKYPILKLVIIYNLELHIQKF